MYLGKINYILDIVELKYKTFSNIIVAMSCDLVVLTFEPVLVNLPITYYLSFRVH